MAGTVARVTEISAKSDTSFEDAVKVGLERANASLAGCPIRLDQGAVGRGHRRQISGYVVKLLVTFILE